MHQCGSHLTDFREVLYLEMLRKISLETPNLVKIGQKFRGFGRLKEFFFVAGDINGRKSIVVEHPVSLYR